MRFLIETAWGICAYSSVEGGCRLRGLEFGPEGGRSWCLALQGEQMIHVIVANGAWR